MRLTMPAPVLLGKPDEALARHHASLRTPLHRYVLNGRLAVILSAPLLYICAIPFALTDLFASLYQAVCFPIYGIPKVRRREYFLYDRGRLRYLNLLERLNCLYCSYANGLFAYLTEIAGRTEQRWCPVEHRRTPRSVHSRYGKFLPYGDAEEYRRRLDTVSEDFRDLR